jgi:sugar lactone lactonase YvrE
MYRTVKIALLRPAVVVLTALTLVVTVAEPAAAGSTKVIVLPGASSAEGIAAGKGSTFYAGDLFEGDIFRGNIKRGTAKRFIDVPDGRMAVGMAFDRKRELLFVAGGFTGQAYVYDTDTRKTVATYRFTRPNTGLINDVALTRRGAWFTDSFQAQLYFVPFHKRRPSKSFHTLRLRGPAADTSGEINVNGIQAVRKGRTLIVGHHANGLLHTVDPATGSSATIAGISVPAADGLAYRDGRLWVVQNTNQVTRVRLRKDLTSGTVQKVITSKKFQVPATGALFGNRLAVTNAKFDTGIPPTADQYEVVVVKA